jgi:WhiB family redox-sensing transcriptional regulator
VSRSAPPEDVFEKLRQTVGAPQLAPWRSEANCLGLDPDLFIPERGDVATIEAARAVCAGCRVQTECLEQSLEGPTWLLGVYGGVTDRGRRRLRRKRQGAA